ncbi:hypothetical protein LIER_26804 [Lithospermum erythrorhizon]|uniref:Uncharacterized protein n=1 Tax=Lithospermum erythrorhizon TaxID=34254 RepID=A0AAV3RBA0_LITER
MVKDSSTPTSLKVKSKGKQSKDMCHHCKKKFKDLRVKRKKKQSKDMCHHCEKKSKDLRVKRKKKQSKDMCHHCRAHGHCKRNCEKYLDDIKSCMVIIC